MAKININLLPPEIKAARAKDVKTVLISRLSILVIVIAILATFVILTISALVNVDLQNKKSQLEELTNRVSQFKETEGLVVILKNRISDIESLLATDSRVSALYMEVSNKLPPNVRLNNFDSDKKGGFIVTGETLDTQALDDFFNNLLTIQVADTKVASGTINSLSQGSGGNIRFEVSLKMAN